jgi:hypothetical protein
MFWDFFWFGNCFGYFIKNLGECSPNLLVALDGFLKSTRILSPTHLACKIGGLPGPSEQCQKIKKVCKLTEASANFFCFKVLFTRPISEANFALGFCVCF